MSFPLSHCRRSRSSLVAALLAAASAAAPAIAAAPLKVSDTATAGSFPLVGQSAVDVVIDDGDAKVVGIAARLLAGDIEQVTGKRPQVQTGAAKQPSVVIGTIGQSKQVDALVAAGKLDVSKVKGKWEAYTLAVVADPWPGVKQALVIAGADRRGTAYGVFTLSQAIGVSPWAWWADVKPTKRPSLHVSIDAPQADAPFVKYRGIFINDEDWGLQPWAAKTFEPEVGSIGPKTYAKVFELLLRLKANYLWPAMHDCTKEFAKVPGNVELADEWGIVMGASHPEPMNRNNVEWNRENRGPWRYDTNRKNIYAYWEEWAKMRGPYEAVWTVGMRGIHDSAMQGPSDMPTKVKLLGEAIIDQRKLLAQYVNKDVKQVPQAFMPYKEALGMYQNGLKVPDDVTLVWCEDNYGYLRQLSTPEEQKRSGGSGIYYHISYLGNPGSYLWFESTPLSLIWAEMDKALQYGADRIWVLNVGDIKNNEIGADFWMHYAWQPKRFDANAQQTFLREWAAGTFGDAFADEIAGLMNDYFTLSMQRKPEFTRPSVFRADGYGEAQARIAAFQALERRATAINERLPAEKRDGFYSLVLYKVHGSARVAESYGYLELGRVAAQQGRPAAAAYGELAKAAVERGQKETDDYNNSFQNGKWKGIVSFGGIKVRPNYNGWMNGILLKWPEPASAEPASGPAKLGISIDGNDAVLLDGVAAPTDTGANDANVTFKDAKIAEPWQRKGDLIGVPDGVTGQVLRPEDARGITVPFTVSEAGTYNLFGQVVTPNDKADSFFVRIDDGPWITWNDIGSTSEPTWRRQGQHKLTAGKHTLTLANREDGAQIAGLRFTRRDVADVPDQRYTVPGRLPTFADTNGRRTATVRVFRTDNSAVAADVKPGADWIKVEKAPAAGNEQVFHVTVDFAAAPKHATTEGKVTVAAGGKSYPLTVAVVGLPADGTAGEIDRVVSIPAAKFSRAKPGKAAEWFVVPRLGREGDAVTIRPATTPGITEPARVRAESPVLEYDFTVTQAGPVQLAAYCLPTHRIHEGRGQRYAVAIDDAEPTIVDFSADGGESGEGGARWREGRLRNTVVTTSSHTLAKPGRHTLKLWMVDPGVAVDKLVLDLGGNRPSELGTPPTLLGQ